MFEEEGISHEKFLLGSSNSRAFSNSANSGKKPPTNPTPVVGQKRGRKGPAKASSSTSHGRDGHGEQSDSEVHIWTERERRKKMRNMFSTLHALLPHLPPKTDKSSIVDEAVNYIQTIEQTLKTLHKQRLEKFRSPTIVDLEPPLTITSDQTQTYLGTPAGSSRNSSVASNMPLSAPTSSQASFRTWFFPNVVMNMCGNDAQICVCSSRKPGLLTTICYILERHKVEVVSANISSDHHRSMFMIHVHQQRRRRRRERERERERGGGRMSNEKHGFLNSELSKKTSIFGLRLWVVLGVCVGAAIVLVLFLISLWVTSKRKSNSNKSNNSAKPIIPNVSKEIQEIRFDPSRTQTQPTHQHQENPKNSDQLPESDPLVRAESQGLLVENENPNGHQRIHIGIGKGHRISYPEHSGGGSSSGEARSGDQMAMVVPEVSHLGWGHWYTLRELEVATNWFADENVIGEGGYGIVYSGILVDNTRVAVKNLLNNRGQAEKEFKVEVEAIGRVRHKNLVRLLGYCAEGAHRILVYEYVDNGNLEQWLHGDVGPYSPLTWAIRMNIVLGTAKGLTYLHEGLEPKVVHRDIKSSNILLDKQWNPKVSDFGLAKLLGSESSYVTTRVMGTFGYVAPEYASTGMLNERSDVYSFGILLMEIITGRNPVDYSRPQGEVNLVDWLKTMVTNRNAEGVLDPKIAEKPSSRALKRALLVALRCVDPNAQKRPKMGYVIHMLEADDFTFRDERRAGRSHRDGIKERLIENRLIESGDSSGYESSVQTNRSLQRKQEIREEH